MPAIPSYQPPDGAALLGADVPGLRPRFEVEEGALVAEGQVLFRDRKHTEIAFAAPMSGRVSKLAYGPRKTLSVCCIAGDQNAPTAESDAVSSQPDPENPRAALLERGFWPAFRTRPFGCIPAPDAVPAAIFIKAVRVGLDVPDPSVVLTEKEEEFHLGIKVLTRLTDGEVFVCQSPGAPLARDDARVTCVSFGGTQAAGLPGTHIDRVFPATQQNAVWSIGYQDTAAIGHLFRGGRYCASRVVAIGGPASAQPRLVRTSLGAGIAGLSGVEQGRAMSGDALVGREALYLGRYHEQVTLLNHSVPDPRRPWMDWFRPAGHALIPTRALDQALAVDIPTVPLLRALSVGDVEAAERLGCLALIEEDVAALSRHCTSGADYARLLRQVLDDLMEGAP